MKMKKEAKLSTISLILGILGVLFQVVIVLGYRRIISFPYSGYFVLIYYFFGWIFFLGGIIFGILSFKSSQRNLGILGIIISVIGFIVYFKICALLLMIGTG